MKNFSFFNRKLFSLIILLLGLAWIWASKAPASSVTGGGIPAPRQGFSAPDFTLKSLDGQSYKLSNLRGKVVLLNLWASWCPPCKAEMPAFERIYNVYRDQGFVVLAVNAANQDTLSDAIAFVNERALTFPILLDTAGLVSAQYQLHSLPTSFFIDRKGTIQEVIIGGPMSEALLRIRVEKLLQEKP